MIFEYLTNSDYSISHEHWIKVTETRSNNSNEYLHKIALSNNDDDNLQVLTELTFYT